MTSPFRSIPALRNVRKRARRDIPNSPAEVKEPIRCVVADPEVAETIQVHQVAVTSHEGEGESRTGIGIMAAGGDYLRDAAGDRVPENTLAVDSHVDTVDAVRRESHVVDSAESVGDVDSVATAQTGRGNRILNDGESVRGS